MPITIGDRVWIGGNTVVLPGVTIGQDTIIAAGSIVVSALKSFAQNRKIRKMTAKK